MLEARRQQAGAAPLSTWPSGSAGGGVGIEPQGQRVRVEVLNAYHRYGQRQVLHGINLALRAGEIYGLLGPNGAGKTTLMRAITGRLRLTGGTVLIDGRNLITDRRARQAVGYVPQDISIYPHLTVAENLQVLARFAGLPAARVGTTVERVMAVAGLTDRAGQLCRTLSGGYQRRVNICASILKDPAALVLDEPTVGIDVDAREAVHGLLLQLRHRGAALLLSTHDLEQAELICDRVGLMFDGRILVEGAPAVLIEQTFGTDQEVVVALARRAGDEHLQRLTEWGLRPTQSPLLWVGRARLGRVEATILGQSLSDVGLSVREVRVRKPDLGSLFLNVLGKTGAP